MENLHTDILGFKQLSGKSHGTLICFPTSLYLSSPSLPLIPPPANVMLRCNVDFFFISLLLECSIECSCWWVRGGRESREYLLQKKF